MSTIVTSIASLELARTRRITSRFERDAMERVATPIFVALESAVLKPNLIAVETSPHSRFSSCAGSGRHLAP